MIRIPYGISNFKTLVTEGYYYVDRTEYIALFESFGEKYITFLRPRRFGKSLFISVLQHYYGLEHKQDFYKIFENSAIGQQPTPLANTYMTLVFDFSGINTDNKENTYKGFLKNVKDGVELFCRTYTQVFDKEDIDRLLALDSPENVVKTLINIVRIKKTGPKIISSD